MGFMDSLQRKRQCSFDEKKAKELEMIHYKVRILSAQVDKLVNQVDKLEVRADTFVDVSALEEIREQVSKNRQSVRTLRERFERYIKHR